VPRLAIGERGRRSPRARSRRDREVGMSAEQVPHVAVSIAIEIRYHRIEVGDQYAISQHV
jgi:hypothetical protein